MQIGIVGLPFSGKSTLFQTITKTHIDAAALAKSETHQSVIKIPDKRLDKLTEIFNPKKKVNAAIEVIDVVGLQKGETGSTQFTSNFLAKVRTNDALIQVVRLFDNESVPHPEGTINMMRDIDSFETEFIISDMDIIERRIDSIKKQIMKSKDEQLKRELPILEKCYQHLQEETPLREAHLSNDELKLLRSYSFLSAKPMLIALNLDEDHVGDSDNFLNELTKKKLSKNTKALAFFGRIEREMSELSDEEALEFMQEYGIKESSLISVIRESYDLLNLHTFFTFGDVECHAWTLKKGANAQEAAGEVHTDFYNKFIRAEVVHYNDFIEDGSFANAKEKGHWRLEGKEYVVQDGDLIVIRHG
ncbi:MAG: redox-regulated ATPase YchF [Ignavibacterium sp.]|nr:MAG: redox-regulated ATPase YchF [Ignavibacterium sp.]